MASNLNEAPAMSIQEAARRLEQNGALVYISMRGGYAICTAGSTKEGYSAHDIITMALALRGRDTQEARHE